MESHARVGCLRGDMSSSFERYERDIHRLITEGARLLVAMQKEFDPKAKIVSDLSPEQLSDLPNVHASYEQWYSKALALVSQLLPERQEDFKSYYKPKGNRKDILHSNYTISDYLRGTTVTRGGDVVVGPNAALMPMYNQFNIVQGL